MSNCFHCGYCQKEIRDNEEVYYCNDLDCEIDPYERICSDENYES